MGASSSKSPTPGTSVQMSPDLINHISSPDSSRGPSLDARIQERINAEVERLRREEADLQSEIEKVLERENLEKETSADSLGGRDSAVLRADVNALTQKLRNASHSESEVMEKVKVPRDNLVACYRYNPKQTLDCWKEAQEFRNAVRQLENDLVASAR